MDVSPVGAGTVQVNGEAIDSYPGQSTIASGESVLLEAVAAPGYQFDSWGGDLSGSANPTSIDMTCSKDIVVIFSEIAQLDTTVAIPDAHVYSDETVVVPINITKVTDLGAIEIWLYYDNSVVEVNSVASGNLGALAASSIDNVNGVTKMNWFSATGQTGDFVFANVTLHAVGYSGDVSVLDLDVSEMAGADGQLIYPDVTEGLFTVTGEAPLPDDEPAVEEGFASIAAFLETAYGFQAGEGIGGWTVYNPLWPPEFNSLKSLFVGRGYWIKVSQACILQYGGNSYQLDSGWNLIGWIPQL